MSATEIFAFDKEGNASLYANAKNAWRGAMAVWGELESRYLPPYIPDHVQHRNWYKPGMTASEIAARLGYAPSRLTTYPLTDNPLQEIWDLYNSPDVTERDKIVLATTFNDVLVKSADLPRVIDAFVSFGGETNLPEQAQILREILSADKYIAVGWNQTSVNGDTWDNYYYNSDTGETEPYNCLTGDKHWWLFSEPELL